VSLSFIFITNSSQIGLLCLNLLGTSGIQDSVITHSNRISQHFWATLKKWLPQWLDRFAPKICTQSVRRQWSV